MQTRLVSFFSSADHDLAGLEAHFNFNRFLDHLREKLNRVDGEKQALIQSVLERFQAREAEVGPVSEENIEAYSAELNLIYHLLVPILQDEKATVWGLAMPVKKKVFFGTNAFYDLLDSELEKACFPENLPGHVMEDLRGQMVYMLIMDRVYGFSINRLEQITYQSVDSGTGLLKYYGVEVDNSFVDVRVKGELPVLNFGQLAELDIQKLGWKDLKEVLPLESFIIDGFAIITLSDRCGEQAVENLKDLIVRRPETDEAFDRQGVVDSLRMLTGNSNLHFSLVPVFRINQRPVTHQSFDTGGFLFGKRLFGDRVHRRTLEKFLSEYVKKPYPVAYNLSAGIGNSQSEIVRLLASHVDSYACIPLTFGALIVGFLEVWSQGAGSITNRDLTKIKEVSPFLAQMCQDMARNFSGKIDDIVRERYTGLQPAVQWKFNEVAGASFLNQLAGRKADVVDEIRFKNIHPLYGAIDIRNSTLFRREAQLSDFRYQLDLLASTLTSLQTGGASVPEGVFARCEHWRSLLAEEIPYDSFVGISDFLKKEIPGLFHELDTQNPVLKQLVADYTLQSDPENGQTYQNRRDFEYSLLEMNHMISDHLDQLNARIQECTPAYFDKFRTDGLEYDFFTGQSIDPGHVWSKEILQRLRALQLGSMAQVARASAELSGSLPVKFETTHLIFVNNGTIDISFRADERRFDVDGGENVRYQIVKKRLDKVLVKETGERLTQPGKIALVYFHQRSMKDYFTIIRELQREGLLREEIETLELNDLQGVSGLKALRLSVKPE